MNLLNFKTFWPCHSWYPRRGVSFKDLLAVPFVGIQEGKSSFAVHDIITFSFLICFVFHNELKHLHVMHVENVLWCVVDVSP